MQRPPVSLWMTTELTLITKPWKHLPLAGCSYTWFHVTLITVLQRLDMRRCWGTKKLSNLANIKVISGIIRTNRLKIALSFSSARIPRHFSLISEKWEGERSLLHLQTVSHWLCSVICYMVGWAHTMQLGKGVCPWGQANVKEDRTEWCWS